MRLGRALPDWEGNRHTIIMRQWAYLLVAVAGCSLHAQALVISFSQVGYTNVGSVSSGTVTAGGTVGATTYTVSGLDLDGDTTNDTTHAISGFGPSDFDIWV